MCWDQRPIRASDRLQCMHASSVQFSSGLQRCVPSIENEMSERERVGAEDGAVSETEALTPTSERDARVGP